MEEVFDTSIVDFSTLDEFVTYVDSLNGIFISSVNLPESIKLQLIDGCSESKQDIAYCHSDSTDYYGEFSLAASIDSLYAHRMLSKDEYWALCRLSNYAYAMHEDNNSTASVVELYGIIHEGTVVSQNSIASTIFQIAEASYEYWDEHGMWETFEDGYVYALPPVVVKDAAGAVKGAAKSVIRQEIKSGTVDAEEVAKKALVSAVDNSLGVTKKVIKVAKNIVKHLAK